VFDASRAPGVTGENRRGGRGGGKKGAGVGLYGSGRPWGKKLDGPRNDRGGGGWPGGAVGTGGRGRSPREQKPVWVRKREVMGRQGGGAKGVGRKERFVSSRGVVTDGGGGSKKKKVSRRGPPYVLSFRAARRGGWRRGGESGREKGVESQGGLGGRGWRRGSSRLTEKGEKNSAPAAGRRK